MTSTTQEMPADPFGRTPGQGAADRELARRERERITARDWHEIPKGFYAVPVMHYEDDEPEVIAHRLFERKVPRTYRTGRVAGRERLVHGTTVAREGSSWSQIKAEIAGYRSVAESMFGPGGYLKVTIDAIVLDAAGPDIFRAKFGQITGKCGYCGKLLTDPRSKLIGIGPDCRGYR